MNSNERSANADLHSTILDEPSAGLDGRCAKDAPFSEVTRVVIGAAFDVFNALGYGFLEKVYQRALQVELISQKISADLEAALPVRYKGVTVGEYFADILVAGEVVVELKVAQAYQRADEAQLLNSLTASGKKVGLLINFGRHKVEFRRFVK
jgi:GxxExxY protein